MLRDEEEMERCGGRDEVRRMLSLMSTSNTHTLPSYLAPGLCRTLGYYHLLFLLAKYMAGLFPGGQEKFGPREPGSRRGNKGSFTHRLFSAQ